MKDWNINYVSSEPILKGLKNKGEKMNAKQLIVIWVVGLSLIYLNMSLAQPDLEVTGTIGGEEPIAIVNGEGVKVGDEVDKLINQLKDEDGYVRRSAAEALVKIGKPAVEPLITALKDKSYNVRRPAAEVLGMIGDSRAVEPLITALKDENEHVREYAAEALNRITGQEFREDYEKWSTWWQKQKK